MLEISNRRAQQGKGLVGSRNHRGKIRERSQGQMSGGEDRDRYTKEFLIVCIRRTARWGGDAFQY